MYSIHVELWILRIKIEVNHIYALLNSVCDVLPENYSLPVVPEGLVMRLVINA